MKIYSFQGELTDISAKKEALVPSEHRPGVKAVTRWKYGCTPPSPRKSLWSGVGRILAFLV